MASSSPFEDFLSARLAELKNSLVASYKRSVAALEKELRDQSARLGIPTCFPSVRDDTECSVDVDDVEGALCYPEDHPPLPQQPRVSLNIAPAPPPPEAQWQMDPQSQRGSISRLMQPPTRRSSAWSSMQSGTNGILGAWSVMPAPPSGHVAPDEWRSSLESRVSRNFESRRTSVDSRVSTFLVQDEVASRIPSLIVQAHHGSHDSAASSGTNEEKFVFHVFPIWKQSKRGSALVASRPTMTGHSTLTRDYDGAEEDDSDSDAGWTRPYWMERRVFDRVNKALQFVITSPNTKRRIFWDLIGVCLLMYDFVVLPLSFLDLPESQFRHVMGWIVRVYWSIDFLFCTFTGYVLPEGRIERRPRKVVMHYACTWMPVDFLILSFDWLELVWTAVSSASIGRLTRSLKFTRLLRMVRIGRLLSLRRTPEFVRALAYLLHSEHFVIVFEILGLVCFLVGLSHLLACTWYALGKEDGWVEADESVLSDRPLDYRYVTSFSWSLTQLTFGGAALGEQLRERTFSVVTALFGFLVSVSVVSFITSSLTRLQIIAAGQSAQVAMLKDFLFDKGISTKVALRVQRNAMYALQQRKKNTPESSIELLSLVSQPLKVELHYEIHMPIFDYHAFFRYFNEVNSATMRRVCHASIVELGLSRGDVLFSSGEVPPEPAMYFCVTGKLLYDQEYTNRTWTLTTGCWACEGTLWVPWVHHGVLRAKTEAILTVVDALKFQSVACNTTTDMNTPSVTKLYSEAFCARLNECDRTQLTDLNDEGLSVEDLCERLFHTKTMRLQRMGTQALRRSECRMKLERSNSLYWASNSLGSIQPIGSARSDEREGADDVRQVSACGSDPGSPATI